MNKGSLTLHTNIMRTINQAFGVVIAIAVWLLLHPELRAQVKVEIDHANAIMKVNGKIVDADTVRVPSSDSIEVDVINTNTALYEYKLTGEKVDVKDVASLQDFTKALGPYLVDIPSTLLKRDKPIGFIPMAETEIKSDPQLDELRVKGAKMKGELTALNELVYGNDGIMQLRMEVLAALSRMAKNERIADVITDVSGRLDARCRGRALSSGLLDRYPSLRKAVVAFEAALAAASDKLSDPDRTQFAKVLDQGRKALDDYDKILAAAYTVEALGVSVLDAKNTWTIKRKPGITWKAGRAVSVAITQKKTPELARLAKADTTYSVVIMPKWRFRTSVGLALMYTPAATFPTYKAVKAGDVYTITELSAEGQDLRLNYGLVLGMSFCNDGNDDLGLAFWTPEITINPSEGVKSIGVGVGLSYNIFKFGTGVQWTRHKVLDGKRVDETISDAEIPLRDEYSNPQFYVSLSVIGWQPFVK